MNHSFAKQILLVLTFACIITPLFVAPWLYSPFQSKVIVFSILVEIALVPYVWLILTTPSIRPRPRSPILLFLLLSALFGIVASFLGVDTWNSLFGNAQRLGGAMLFLHMTLLVLYLDLLFKHAPKKRHLAVGLLITTAVVSAIIALLQLANLIPSLDLNATRLSSVFGNPLMFASFLPIPLLLCLRESVNAKKKTRYLFLILALLLTVTLTITGSRGPLLGVFIGTLFCGVFYLRQYRHKMTKKARVLILTTLLITMIATAGTYAFAPKQSLAYRVTHTNQTVDSRLILWSMAWDAIKHAPLLGYGPENFAIPAERFFNPQHYQNTKSWPDKPHNFLLELWVSQGIIGLIIFLTLLILLATKFWRLSKHDNANIWLLGALIAYVVQGLFLFDTQPVLISLAVLIALGLFENNPASGKSHPRWALYIACASSIGVLFMILRVYLPTWTFLSDINRATDRTQTSVVEAVALLEQVTEQSFIPDRATLASKMQTLGAEAFSDSHLSHELRNSIIKKIVEHYEKFLATTPPRALYWTQFASVQTLARQADTTRGLKQIEQAVEQAKTLAPLRVEADIVLAYAHLFNQDFEQTENLMLETESRAPQYPDTFWIRGVMEHMRGRDDVGADLAMQGLRRNVLPANSDELVWIANTLAEQARLDDLIFVYNTMLQINPAQPQILASLATTYAQNGQLGLAEISAKRMIELDPTSRSQVDAFIQSIQSQHK